MVTLGFLENMMINCG